MTWLPWWVAVVALFLAVLEHRRRVVVVRDLREAVRVLVQAVSILRERQQREHLSPLILAQALRMQDAQDETDAYRAKGGRAR